MKFHILDVFGSRPYSGNQLAVFHDAGKLSVKEMQLIAREIHFSETTFITGKKCEDGGFPVRIFTPGAEVEFAGHPTLGTAFIIGKYLNDRFPEKVCLNLKAGQIPVTSESGKLWMKQNQPVYGKIIPYELLGKVLGIQTGDFNDQYPAEEVSTGLPFTIVPVKSKEVLKKARVNPVFYDQFIQQAGGKGIMIFCPEGHTPSQNLSSRVFVDYLGIPEDPATGSATGCLAAWLIKHRMFGNSHIELTIGQGYEMGRDSELYIKATLRNDHYELMVGGKVFEIAEGSWEAKL